MARGLINPWRIAGWGLAAVLLLIPLVAMRVTDGVFWTGADFLFAAAMLGMLGGGIELAVRRSASAGYRSGAALLFLTVFLLVWIDAAVGIVGDGDGPMGPVYPGVAAVTVAVALAGGLGARAMAIAAGLAAAAMLALAPVAVAVAGGAPPGAIGLLVLHGGFAGLFTVAALLFRRAARSGSRPVPGGDRPHH